MTTGDYKHLNQLLSQNSVLLHKLMIVRALLVNPDCYMNDFDKEVWDETLHGKLRDSLKHGPRRDVDRLELENNLLRARNERLEKLLYDGKVLA